MRKTITLLFAALISTIGYTAAGPHITIHNIKTGFINKDSVKLSENIDFPALRQNLKDQLNARMISTASEYAQENPMGTLATGIVTVMTDRIIESVISPGGMAAIMSGKKLDSGNQETPDYEKLFKDSRFTYDSLNHFSLWIKNDNGQESRLVLQRDALNWKLVNIVIPAI